MRLLGQYSQNEGGVAAIVFVWLMLLLLLVLAIIPANIAKNKGHSWGGFYVFGLFFFLPALIVALLISPIGAAAAPASSPRPETARLPRAPAESPIASPVDIGLEPGPGVVRECPFCKEATRRDASVCPHCRRESPAWRYDGERWWTRDPQGAEVWYDEYLEVWRAESDTGEVSQEPPEPPFAMEKEGIAYVGEGYCLGWKTRFGGRRWVIWDTRREEPREVDSFDGSKTGWNLAWAWYVDLEPDPTDVTD